MNRLEAMTILLAAVDSGSLSAAGRQLHVPLATVSRRVSELEEHLKAHRELRRGGRDRRKRRRGNCPSIVLPNRWSG
jgi:DNA-binding transcriptional LysR family regulator